MIVLICVALVALNAFTLYTLTKQINDLCDRVQARDFKEFKVMTKPKERPVKEAKIEEFDQV